MHLSGIRLHSGVRHIQRVRLHLTSPFQRHFKYVMMISSLSLCVTSRRARAYGRDIPANGS
jgi:hypothetical protein